MSPSVSSALEAILSFLDQRETDSEWHPCIFTSTGHRSGTAHAIRKLKKAGFIKVSADYGEGPLYVTGPNFVKGVCWTSFE